MRTLLLGCGAMALLLVLAMGGCGWMAWRAVADMPADAKRERLFPANRQLIERIDAAIRDSERLADLAARLHDAITDERVLFLGLTDESVPTSLDAIKRLTWEGESTSTWNGAGWGHLTTKFERREIRIIESRERMKSGASVRYRLYLEPPADVEKR